ncbi:MAG: polymerase subunit sigma-24 [Pedosphaera sp.]|jgi:RNA polymerase sigma-70 factor (ECF subfamily)|nr:polymerase subunit sigma-24 [Pedosphaera sp.]
MSGNTSDQQDSLDMARLANGHDVALNDLMERHGGKLLHYLIRQLQDETEAADVAQEAFVRIYLNRAKFKKNARFLTWLYAIATNLVRDRFRSRARRPQVSLEAENPVTGGSLGETLPEEKPSPRDIMEGDECAEAVRRVIALLPEELRTPLILAEYEELSQAEIAEILGCSPKAVETRIYRARQQLRLQLVKLLDWL